jgi:hypothetical protein
MMEMPSFRRRFRTIRWLILVLLVLFIGFGGVYLLDKLGPGGQTGLQLLPVSLKPFLKANYIIDPMANQVLPMEFSFISYP